MPGTSSTAAWRRNETRSLSRMVAPRVNSGTARKTKRPSEGGYGGGTPDDGSRGGLPESVPGSAIGNGWGTSGEQALISAMKAIHVGAVAQVDLADAAIAVIQRRTGVADETALAALNAGGTRELKIERNLNGGRAQAANLRRSYFNELLIEENLVLSFTPIPFTAAMMASEMPAAIRPYSMAVAAVSSARNLRMVFMPDTMGLKN